jgi:hypothetical protein
MSVGLPPFADAIPSFTARGCFHTGGFSHALWSVISAGGAPV